MTKSSQPEPWRGDLNELRDQLDSIDNAITKLLAERFQVTENVGKLKAKHQLPARDASREDEKFEAVGQMAERNGLAAKYAVTIYKCIMDTVVVRHNEVKDEQKT